jgi:hypothetical protein
MFSGNSCSFRYSGNVTRRFVPDNIAEHRAGTLLILHTHTSRATSQHLLQLFPCKNSKSRIIELTEHPDAVHHICRHATTPDLFTPSPRCEDALSRYGPVFHDTTHTRVTGWILPHSTANTIPCVRQHGEHKTLSSYRQFR